MQPQTIFGIIHAMQVYHYTKPIKLEGIFSKGLWTVGYEYDGHFQEDAVYALLKPLHNSWRRNHAFPELWDNFIRHTGPITLGINLRPTDRVFVQEYAHIEGYVERDKTTTPLKYRHPSGITAHWAYDSSKIALADYLNRATELAYLLPEVVILNNIPTNRVHFLNKQPLLDDLFSGKGIKYFTKNYLRDVQRVAPAVPKLVDWCTRHGYSITSTEGNKPAGKER